MEEEKIKEYHEKVTGFITTLSDKNAAVENLTPDMAETLLVLTECISSSLQSFVFCMRQDAVLAGERK